MLIYVYTYIYIYIHSITYISLTILQLHTWWICRTSLVLTVSWFLTQMGTIPSASRSFFWGWATSQVWTADTGRLGGCPGSPGGPTKFGGRNPQVCVDCCMLLGVFHPVTEKLQSERAKTCLQPQPYVVSAQYHKKVHAHASKIIRSPPKKY